ncbi:MAG: HAD-IIA family hydrolase [Corynebacterium casei]|uniref:HAD-IIA family hydrolase n=1 Tax=Corynebacterium casei TaxID=160386 RepID=UPI00264A1EE6|nr:HAD-IIA family hydrolase [Corynebacterium casei]MDN5800411.1 HAD-IIA family hydrolase [Corynebacterium casei]MDN5923251.1 HAD-IIA family hydrolase [Corynebacterium casei]MDN6263519.1 HAD-IIA family hydrolase [Corynebacterium casei]MDN6274452.1 HAD-IIA family hydrolase [Corynebacterium casei]MDN6286323.1 HAD-IIA family hydrolase [Corynebacterium casei]
MSLIEQHDALLLDLDGTVWEGGRAIDGAVDFINSCGLPSVYVTNNASRAPEAVAEKLRGIGLKVETADVLTSAQAAVTLAGEHVPQGAKILVIGADSFRDLVTAAGYTVVASADDKPDAVLQGFDPSVDWAQLTEGALAIRQGAKYVASNLDSSLPTERGLAVGNGSLVAAIESATGVSPVSAGKPEPEMFVQAAKLVGAKRPLVVGDRLNTDIAGGNAAAMNTFHVLTGVSHEMELIEASKEYRPNFIGDSLSDMTRSAHELAPGAQGGFTARVDGHDVLVDNGDSTATSVQALRTVLEVVWSMGKAPRYIQPVSEKAESVIRGWS